jgi:AbrB family looped-hinge helix DNA binding protein
MGKLAVVDERGRIVIPQAIRDAMGVSPGSMIGIEKIGDHYVLVNEGNARERLIAAFANLDHSMADRLTAERQEP